MNIAKIAARAACGGARLKRDGIEELKTRVDLVELAERDAAGTAETDDG
jgi:hypothetical protein